jgi:hypothetical protein
MNFLFYVGVVCSAALFLVSAVRFFISCFKFIKNKLNGNEVKKL